MAGVDTKFELCQDVEQVLRIGRNFQNTDRWHGAHYDTVKLLCDTIEYLRDQLPKPAPAGNNATMREALERNVCSVSCALNCPQQYPGTRAHVDMLTSWLLRIKECAAAALSTPPRNCDVGTAEEQEARYFKLKTECNDRLMRCPHMGTAINFPPDSLEWAQMPYEE